MLRRQEVPLASHDDADEEHIAEAIRDGVTISEFPTTLAAAKAARAAGMRNVMGAPNVILGGSQSGNLAAMEAARHQVVDALSSDYAPVSLIHAAFAIARELELPLEQTVRWISANPASMAQLEDRGRIEPGLRADLVEVAIVHEVPCVVRVWREGVRVA
jgi:alpha-D-ribose 1-methylphosphonate 5-triphosphate diphosphatase